MEDKSAAEGQTNGQMKEEQIIGHGPISLPLSNSTSTSLEETRSGMNIDIARANPHYRGIAILWEQ